jgi:CBS domain-containing protein
MDRHQDPALQTAQPAPEGRGDVCPAGTDQGRPTDLSLFAVRVDAVASRAALVVPPETPIREAARIMLKEGVGSLLVGDGPANAAGIVTDTDLRKAVALRRDLESGVRTIMSGPVASIAGHESLFDALLAMMARKVRHLAVTGAAGSIGVITAHDILLLHGASPLSLFQEIRAQRDFDGIYPLLSKAPRVIQGLMDGGARAGHVTRLITVVNDLILHKIIELTHAQIGPPPLAYCWMAMGSEGRREQTFATDQDNALILADSPDEPVRRAAAVYFEAFAGRVVGHLEKAGFPLCKGNMMAVNPVWRKSLSAWKAAFDDWMAVPEPTQVLHSTIFFDFRGVAGTLELAGELRGHVVRAAPQSGIFLHFLARDCLSGRPPLTLFRGIAVDKSGEHKHTLDIKHRALVPFQDFARVLALAHGVAETGTLPRMAALVRGGHVPEALGREAAQAFEFLLTLKLAHQLAQATRGLPPDTRIDPRDLSEMDQGTLRDALSVIGAMQSFVKDVFHLAQG